MRSIKLISIVLGTMTALWLSFSLGRRMRIEPASVNVSSTPTKKSGSRLPSSPNIRWVMNEDGTYSIYTLKEKNVLTKRVIKSDGLTQFVAEYCLDNNGRAHGCKIIDADGKPVYKISYGYRKNDGKLVEERVYRDGLPRTSDALFRVIYLDNENNTKPKPVVIGRDNAPADPHILGVPSAFFENPFADQF